MSDEKQRPREPDCLCSAYSLPITCPVHPYSDEVVQDRDPFEEAMNRSAGALVLMGGTDEERKTIRLALWLLWEEGQRVALDGPPWSIEGAAETQKLVEDIQRWLKREKEECDRKGMHNICEHPKTIHSRFRSLLAVVEQQRRENGQLRTLAAAAESGMLQHLRSPRVLTALTKALMEWNGAEAEYSEAEGLRFERILSEALGWQRLG